MLRRSMDTRTAQFSENGGDAAIAPSFGEGPNSIAIATANYFFVQSHSKELNARTIIERRLASRSYVAQRGHVCVRGKQPH